MTPKLSIIVPVYNERRSLPVLMERLQALPVNKEIIIVDDGSSDGTTEDLRISVSGEGCVKLYHSKNCGKGAAVRTALEKASGDYVVIQDADFEYDPNDLVGMFRTARADKAPVVYGSRFSGRRADYPSVIHRVFHWAINHFVSVLYRAQVTDVATCYKMLTIDLVKSLDLSENGFGLDAQITAQILRGGCRIREVPVSYTPRTYSEGKKVTWLDGVAAFWIFLKYRFTRFH